MGGGGGLFGGGGQPSPPRLDVNQSAQLLERQLQLQNQYLPTLARTAGTTEREQASRNLQFALEGFTDPASMVYGGAIADAQEAARKAQESLDAMSGWRKSGRGFSFNFGDRNITSAASRYYDPKARKWVSAQDYEKQRADLQRQIDQQNQAVAGFRARDPVGDLQRVFSAEFANRDRLLRDMEAARASTPEYQRMQQALGRGVTAQQADMERVQAQETGQSAIGSRLMDEAMRKMDQGGRLSPEAQREAVQSARQGMAARGMATGNAALGAELLNRDRFARQREFENLGFAQGVEAADLARRTQNTMNRQQAGMQNAQAFNQLSQFNTLQRADTDRFNIGLLGQSAALADAERARQLGLGQDAYNFGLSTNPRMMLAGLGSPYANMTGNAMQMVAGARGLEPMYSGGSFSKGGNSAMGGLLGTLGGAGLGALGVALAPATFGTSLLPAMAAGAGIGGGVGGMLSDKREKTDIKPLGTLSNVLKIPAYEYRYKGEKKKRKGVMAQDVQKVLPEAVAEVDYQGKKRLAIKPDVIGAALAEELTNQTKAVAA